MSPGPRTLDDVAWDGWKGADRATLLFVVRDDEVLLIHKKRGLGKGKVNGPGGKLDPGETPAECAVRECEEEIGITPLDPECMGQHRFQFTDGYSIHCWVFRASDFDGEPVETDEATPFWCRLDEIPFDEMWEDDRHWLPLVLDGQAFDGRWVFDGDRMLDHDLRVLGPAPARASVKQENP